MRNFDTCRLRDEASEFAGARWPLTYVRGSASGERFCDHAGAGKGNWCSLGLAHDERCGVRGVGSEDGVLVEVVDVGLDEGADFLVGGGGFGFGVHEKDDAGGFAVELVVGADVAAFGGEDGKAGGELGGDFFVEEFLPFGFGDGGVI